VLLILLHGFLIARIAAISSPNLDEPAHLSAGLSHWAFGNFDLYRVNPPLVRMLAALPVLATGDNTDWMTWNPSDPYGRPEFSVGHQFIARHDAAVFRQFTLARWACIPLCMLGAWVCYRWSRDLFGPSAGLTALTLYVFCPNLLAWGASITPDAASAATGICAGYVFWRWLRKPDWSRTLLCGAALGLAELTKSTWIILFALWPVLWLIWHASDRKVGGDRSQSTRAASFPLSDIRAASPAKLATVLLIGIYLINVGYGFERSFRPLGEFTFISRALTGEDRPSDGGNRFRSSVLSGVPVPFPENYLRGMDVQKFDFEQGKWSYLRGEQKRGGWWYYYLYALLVKTPVGTLALFVLATVLSLLRRDWSAGWRNELLLIVPAVAVLVMVSLQTGFNRYLRYVLPAVPFLYLHISRVGLVFARRNRWMSLAVAGCLVATTIESLTVFPHTLSFFHQLAGGPENGDAHLLDGNIDWGQDLLVLKAWYDAHPQARPFHLAYFGTLSVDPRVAGIDWRSVPGWLPDTGESRAPDRTGPQPGWFAVSVNHLRGYRHYDSDRPRYTYFMRLTPTDRVGFSMLIYHVTRDEANRLRRELGLPELPQPSETAGQTDR